MGPDWSVARQGLATHPSPYSLTQGRKWRFIVGQVRLARSHLDHTGTELANHGQDSSALGTRPACHICTSMCGADLMLKASRAHRVHVLSPPGLHPLPRAGCLRSPSWTRMRAEQNLEKQPLGDPERQAAIVDTFLTVERPKED